MTGSGETGKPERGSGRKHMVGEGLGNSQGTRRLQEAPGSLKLLLGLGLPLSPGRARIPPGTAQAGLLNQEPRD